MGMKQAFRPTTLGLELCQLVTNKWDELVEILLIGSMEKNRENWG